MKRIFPFGLMLASVFALTNCTEEFVDPTIPNDEVTQETTTPEGEGIPFQFYASVASETKTTGDANFKTSWDDNDQISVFYAEVDNSGSEGTITSAGNFTISDKDNGIFNGFLPEGISANKTYNWYFVYDASKEVIANSKKEITVNIGSEIQTQSAAGSTAHISEASNCLMTGTAPKLSGSIIPRVRMKHSSALVALKVMNQGDGVDNGEANISISNLTFSVTKAVNDKGTQVSSVPIVGAFSTSLNGKTYTAATGSSNSVTLNLASPVEITPGNEAIFYLAIRPFYESLKVSELEVGINTTATSTGINVQKRKVTIETPSENHFKAGNITTVQVPVKLSYPKESDAIGITGSSGEKLLSFPVSAQSLNANGETVSAYILGDGDLQELTIIGTGKDIINALDVGFYASTWQGRRAAMTVNNLNVWLPNDNGGLTKISDYSALETVLKEELSDDITGFGSSIIIGLGVPIVLGTLSNGIPRDDQGSLSFIYLTKFIDPQTITFNGVIENNATDSAQPILFLDESPIYKEIKAKTVNDLLKGRFSHNGQAPTYAGLLDIVNEKNTTEANTTASVLYDKLYDVVAGRGSISMTLDIKFKKYDVDIDLAKVFKALILDPADLKAKLPKMKFELKISTCPYKPTKAEYGSKSSPIKLSEITGDKNPIIFWGLDVYGPDASSL